MNLSRRTLLRTLGLSSTFAAIQFPPSRSLGDLFFNGARGEALTRPIRLNNNENPYGPSPRVAAAMRGALDTANRYPLGESRALVSHIAEFHRVRPEQVLLGCGSSEILRAATATFLGARKRIIVPLPTFEGITDYARAMGAAVVAVPLDRTFAHDLDGMLRQVNAATHLVYICNPNNPTASLTPRKDLEAFIAKLPATTYVLIDEAYHDYAGETSMYGSFLDRPLDDERVIVTRTFSAVYGLAGLRLGYAVTAPTLVERMRPYLTMNNVNAIAAYCAITAMQDTESVRTFIEKNTNDRQEFFNHATARMLKPIDSHANFVMMNTRHPADDVIQHFRKHNILIGRRFPPMDTYIRMSLGTREEMKSFWHVWDLLPFAKTAM